MDPDWVDVFPIEHGDIPASYVSLPESIFYTFRCSPNPSNSHHYQDDITFFPLGNPNIKLCLKPSFGGFGQVFLHENSLSSTVACVKAWWFTRNHPQTDSKYQRFGSRFFSLSWGVVQVHSWTSIQILFFVDGVNKQELMVDSCS